MPVTPTYPGVYIEEIPSGVRTITGVSTAVTAFIGYTRKGEVNKAQEISSFSDFERKFGGLARDSLVSYAVRQFFMNGGQRAIIVRITEAGTASNASVTLNSLASGSAVSVLQITAKEPGAWANGIQVTVDYDTAHPDSTFNLRITDPVSGQSEPFLGLSMNPQSRRNVDRLVNTTSQIVNATTTNTALNSVTARGESISGNQISPNDLDANHRQFMITMDETDGPRLITIYDGTPGNQPADLNALAIRIRDAVRAIDSNEPYQSFSCQADTGNDSLTLTSGYQGSGSFVRVTNSTTLNAASVLKLGVMNGGREIDAVSGIRPAAVGSVSGSLSQLPSFTGDRRMTVTIDGDGPHKLILFKIGEDQPPANSEDLRTLKNLLQNRLRRIRPNVQGSMAFLGINVNVVGNSIQIISGSDDPNSRIEFQNYRPSLNSVVFISPTNGWIVGENSAILSTTDGGTNWTLQNAPAGVTADMHGVYFVDANTGWAVGAGAAILNTADGGTNWTPQNAPAGVTADMHGVYFVDANTGWAVGAGAAILNTADGGTNWTPQNAPAGVTADMHGVYFVDANTGWAVGAGAAILNTADGGTNWMSQGAPSGVTSNLFGVFFRSATNGWCAGDGATILSTSDGGASWISQSAPQGVSANLRSVKFRSLSQGLIAGESGTILTTTDGGATWTAQMPPAQMTSDLLDLCYRNASSNAWAVGRGGAIIGTVDDGNTWSEQTTPNIDSTADDLQLSATQGRHNVKAYTLGTGRAISASAQTSVLPGTDGNPPRPGDYAGNEAAKTGIYALLDVDIFNILCLPGVTDFNDTNDVLAVLAPAVSLCESQRAFLIIDCPDSWNTLDMASENLTEFDSIRSSNAAMYFPRIRMPDPLDENRLRTFPPSGIVAGLYARTDSERGVWKAPAGQEVSLTGVRELVYNLTDRENGILNPLGLNCLRYFPVIGPIIWGARTLYGADVLASEWKYIPVRRTALFIEETLYRGLQWVVFEPNDEPLWSQIRLNVGAFMHNLFRQGAFQGSTPRDAYLVKCDGETTTQNDINRGIVNILVGFAPLKPAEFVIIRIQQLAGQTQT